MYKIIYGCFCVVFCTSLYAQTCDFGSYADNGNCVMCPARYPYSTTDAASINDCYLINAPGTYVNSPGQAPDTCPENYYCPGNMPVLYNLGHRFRRVQYIKGTGTQYIDTGIILGSDVDTKLVFETGIVAGDQALFGARNASSPRLHYWLNSYSNAMYVRYGTYAPPTENLGGYSRDEKHTLEVMKGDWMLDGRTIYSSSDVFNVGIPGYLFALDAADNPTWIHKSMKLYSFEQWRDNQKVIDLIPVYDVMYDRCSMLDLVTGKIFENSGTGKFECGEIIEDNIGPNGAAACAAATDNVAPHSPAGADDVMDCGRVMHLSDNYKLYLRTRQYTTPSLKVQFGDNIFYGDSTVQECGHLRVRWHGQNMSVCNMDVDI